MKQNETTRSLKVGEVVCGRYEIKRLAGSGAMGEIFVADDTWLRTFVALKTPIECLQLDGTGRARLCAEVALAQKVGHPNVCRVYDLIEHDGAVMLKMELVTGETLAEVLSVAPGRLDAEARLRVAYELCAGVDAIHQSGVVHRDLKPSNVMIDRRGRTVIIDFGISDRACAPSSPRSGTRGYMAPEQLMGGAVTPKSDLYCLGLLLYELFVGRPPFAASTPGELTAKQERGPRFPPRCPRLEAGIIDAIERCLRIDPAERPDSAREVAERLPGSMRGVFCVAAEDGGIQKEVPVAPSPIEGRRQMPSRDERSEYYRGSSRPSLIERRLPGNWRGLRKVSSRAARLPGGSSSRGRNTIGPSWELATAATERE